MSNIELTVSLPLDNGYFRRECPLCMKEFKVLVTPEELTDFKQKGLDSFMLEVKAEDEDSDADVSRLEIEYYCPYCGQAAAKGSWWTQDQLNYLSVFKRNIAAKLINENLIRPLKKSFGSGSGSGFISMKFTGDEMQQQEPWISNEESDMQEFDLSCCQRKIKIAGTEGDTIYCFFCGFPHKISH